MYDKRARNFGSIFITYISREVAFLSSWTHGIGTVLYLKILVTFAILYGNIPTNNDSQIPKQNGTPLTGHKIRARPSYQTSCNLANCCLAPVCVAKCINHISHVFPSHLYVHTKGKACSSFWNSHIDLGSGVPRVYFTCIVWAVKLQLDDRTIVWAQKIGITCVYMALHYMRFTKNIAEMAQCITGLTLCKIGSYPWLAHNAGMKMSHARPSVTLSGQ